jgi:hypothetical protein
MVSEAIATFLPTEAQHSPKVLRHLGDSIRGQLMQLDPILKQDLGENQMRQHWQPRSKTLLEDNNLIIIWLWDNLIPRLMCGIFSKIS